MSRQRLLSPEEIAVQAGQQVPFLRLPERTTVYAERAMRLRQRAASHPMGDYLRFVADIAEAQQTVLDGYPVVALAGDAALDAAARLGVPPLPATLWPRDPLWREGLRRLLRVMVARLDDTPARSQVVALLAADDAWLERQADRLLAATTLDLDLAAAPLIAAGLQVYWTHLVLATGATADLGTNAAAFGRVDDQTSCPCCASRPTASIVRIGGQDAGFRYLHCSLCSAQWHLVRIKCARCLGTQGIHYQALQAAAEAGEARQPAIEAETCDRCGHYLKIVHMARDPEVEPVADDLASVTLDLLVAESGFERHGVDLLLLFGESDGGDSGRSDDRRDNGGDEGSGSEMPARVGR